MSDSQLSSDPNVLWLDLGVFMYQWSMLYLKPWHSCWFLFWWQVQFQKIQQLRLSQSRAPYYGGSLPNVNQIGKTSAEFQVGRRRCLFRSQTFLPPQITIPS